MAKLDVQKARDLLQGFDFGKLFVEELGWSQPTSRQAASFDCKADEFQRKQITQLSGVEVDEYVGINAAVTETASLWMKLEGEEIEPSDAPTSVVTKMLDVLRVGVQAVAEFLSRGAMGIRPTAQIKDACDLRITAWVPGSVKVGLRLPEIDPTLPQEIRYEAERALNLYLQTATWVASEDDAGL